MKCKKCVGKSCKDCEKLTTKCPSCGKDTFIKSIFGSICSNEGCFYEDKNSAKLSSVTLTKPDKGNGWFLEVKDEFSSQTMALTDEELKMLKKLLK